MVQHAVEDSRIGGRTENFACITGMQLSSASSEALTIWPYFILDLPALDLFDVEAPRRYRP
jgi:hypothetical protein